ncbi:monocarboxylate transporter [Plakobranchus ocellatus]|uniref:Monocarboxylate transporter n=1 Tax=Plakobranchus ocellatus TaxID=259542 RepID=A0AAV3YZJ4_9GAST|nr:monocarboxylate transporter [Plakobranchus ocellatus]
MGAILEQVENDLTKASWVGSVFVCVMSFSGPFVGSVLNRFGARWTVSCAGIVISLGFIGASLSTSIVQLILTHGIVSGLGAGFTVNPLFVTVGQYFNKYRGFACGILAAGAGAGMLAGGAFVSYLLTMFDLNGTYLIWAGIMLHVTPVGLLLLPSPEERIRQIEKDIAIGELKSQPDAASVNSGVNSLFGSIDQSMLSGIDRISIGAYGRRMIIPGGQVSRRPSKLMPLGTAGTDSDVDIPLLKTTPHNEMSRSSHSVNRVSVSNKSPLNKSISDIYGPMSPLNSTYPTNTPILEGQASFVNGSTPSSTAQNYLAHSSYLSPSSNTLNSLGMIFPGGPVINYRHQSQQNGQHRLAPTPSFLQLQGPQSQYTSTSYISTRLSLRNGIVSTAPRGELDNESITSTFVSSLRPRDTLTPRQPLGSRSISTILGSVASFPTSLAIVKDDLRRFQPVGPYDGSFKGYIIAMLDSMRIVRNKPFCIFVGTNFFWALGESPVFIHLPSYVVSRGSTVLQASSLYTSMGLASMSGRFLSGLVASDVSIGPVLLYTGSLGVAGVVVCLCPLITVTFLQQIIFSFLVGLYTGALVPLTSLITIELLGISELSLGFGLISMAQGLGYLIGPPLSSVVIKSIGFVNAFVCSGFVLITGSLLAMSMTLSLSMIDTDEELDMQEKERHPLGELERALQKLADETDPCDPDQEHQSINIEEADCGDGQFPSNEKNFGKPEDDKNCVRDDKENLTAASNSPLVKTDRAPRFVEDSTVDLVERDARDGMPWLSAGTHTLHKEDISTPVRAFDELDTIVEVVGK